MHLRTSSKHKIIGIAVLLLIQSFCTLFFVWELVSEVFGFRNWALPWQWREILQLSASVGLLAGTFTAGLFLARAISDKRSMERQLRAASGEFFKAMDEFFNEWGLSTTEKDVALFAVRGYTNTEIAELRGKSQATIKTQMNAVFRKADVTNRAQLVSRFVDLLIEAEATK